jgi:hypothetical protein
MQGSDSYFKFFTRLLKAAVGIYLLGIVWMIVHWPYALNILLFSYVAIAILIVLRFLFRRDKRLTDYLLPLCVITWVVCGIFKIQHWPFPQIMRFLHPLSFGGALILFFLEGREAKKIKLPTLSGLLPVLSAGLILIGILFQVLHLTGGKSLLLMGFFSLAAWFLLDWMKEDKES